MKKLKLLIFLSLGFLFLWNCSNKSTNFSDNNKQLKIYHLQNSYSMDFYVIDYYEDNENCIKYIFEFVKDKKNTIGILTDKNTFKFEDGIDFLKDTTKQRFSFYRNSGTLNNTSIYVNVLRNMPVSFNIEEKESQKQLKADFETLTVNTVQNFLDYAKKDQVKKQTETYTYLLLNKKDEQKMKLNYHEYGDWFEVEIF